jgi:hypothetical protein
MVLILSLPFLIIVIFSVMFLGKVLTISPEQREINDKEQMQWMDYWNQKKRWVKRYKILI